MDKKEGVRKVKLTKTEIEKQLIDNFVNLQKVLTNLAIKFDMLSENISKLLQLFEISAKSFVEKLPEDSVGSGTSVKEKDKEFLNKIDTLLEQNKTIARGLTLMEEKLRERIYGGQSSTIGVEKKEERPRYPRL